MRLATLAVLGAIVIASIASLTIVAVATDRDLTNAGRVVFGMVLLMALAGGVSLADRGRPRFFRQHERDADD